MAAALVLSASRRGGGEQAEQPPKGYEGISLFGTPLTAAPAGAAALAAYETARRDFETARTEDHYIWLGRRTAYLGRYREAIAVYSEGLQKHPDSYRLYRHRGHRYISIRRFVRAIADFEKAAALAAGKPLEVEPDGAPNRAVPERGAISAPRAVPERGAISAPRAAASDSGGYVNSRAADERTPL
jgi:tetratricopeptide (TPR) repeat protein